MRNDTLVEAPTPRVGGIDTEHLQSFIRRLERLEIEKRDLAGIIKDLKTEIKSAGFDPAAIATIVKTRLADDKQREKMQTKQDTLDIYLHALGEFADTPLGEAMRPAA